MTRGNRDRNRLGAGRRGWAVRLVLTLGVLGVLTIPGTQAAWTDPVSVSGTTLSTGTVDLKVENADSVTTFTSLNLPAWSPGTATPPC